MKSSRQTARMQPPAMRPISSAIAAKIKSIMTKGIFCGAPCVSPAPHRPPKLMAKSDCAIWYPLLSMDAKGSMNTSTRTRMCSKSRKQAAAPAPPSRRPAAT